ncbi:uncharacterized protein At1g51745-like isoform X2 [Magnolia sinica]|uniref:uncharacterized protein At1g51745-like isoform X2 n=1 Tax=Magnolia sinica TaxID=86752 RepID=UPI0026580C08|nr:uncharacterized protein At1g51745-like isoform X2 [Magnolia sinica]
MVSTKSLPLMVLVTSVKEGGWCLVEANCKGFLSLPFKRDWYNLEKSKRVKAFRCGEFDECIKKAESSQGMPIKKREKYARREDAILHALELEKQQHEKEQQKLGIASNYISNKIPGTLKKELGSLSLSENHVGNNGARDHSKFINFKPQLLSKRPDSFLEEESMQNRVYTEKGKLVKHPNWEDDNSEVIPRMRGLQDFGLQIAPSKRKLSTSVACEGSRKPFSVENHAHLFPNGQHNIGNANHFSSIKNSLAIKRKRSLGGVTEESLVKRRDRRRPLVQVLQSSAKLPACQPLQLNGDGVSISTPGEMDQGSAICRAKRSRCVYLPADSNDCLDLIESPDQMRTSPSHFGVDNYLLHPGSLTEDNTSSGLIEAQESDSSETDYSDPDMEEEAAVLSDPRNLERYTIFRAPEQIGNMNNEELDECALSSDMSQLHPHEQTAGIAADMGGSKWQLKGKRNIRNLTKRPMEVTDGRDSIIIADKCNGSIRGPFLEAKGNVAKVGRMDSPRALEQGLYHRSGELNYAYDEDDLTENDFGQNQMVGHGNRRYPLTLKASSRDQGRNNSSAASSDDDSHLMSPSSRGAGRSSQAALRRYWEESDECFDPVYSNLIDGVGGRLMDVDLKVQASYHGERVPLVSLMSRLNGKAIVGHPVQIEAMEDGSSDLLLSTNDFGEDLPESDGNAALPPVWRTARRTAMHRVPRPPPSAALEGEADPPQCSDMESEPPFKKPNAGHYNHKVNSVKKSFSHIRRPVVEKKFPKKLLKKISLSSQKTRTLSSIATQQKLSGKKSDPKLDGMSGDLDSTIKPEKTVPSVSCVPVKLVFSRILEAVGRPPSKAATSSAEGKPS